MVNFQNDFYDKKRQSILDEIERKTSELNNVNNDDKVSIAELSYAKRVYERMLSLVDDIKYYPNYMYKYSLLEADFNAYKKYLKSEIFHEIVAYNFEIGRLDSIATEYEKELSGDISKEKQGSLKKTIASLYHKMEELKAKVIIFQSETEELKDATKDELLSKLIIEGQKEKISNIIEIPAYNTFSKEYKAIYKMMKTKAGNDKLQSSITKIRVAEETKENLTATIKVPYEVSIKTHLFLEDKMGFKDNQKEFNYYSLMNFKEKLGDINSDLIINLKKVIMYNNPKVLQYISSNRELPFNEELSILKSIMGVEKIPDYSELINLYNRYKFLQSKPLKSFKKMSEAKELNKEIAKYIKNIKSELSSIIIREYLEVFQKLDITYDMYPLTISNIIKKYDYINETFNVKTNDLGLLLEVVNNSLGKMENERSHYLEEQEAAKKEIEIATGYPKLDLKSFLITNIATFKIFDAVFYSETIDEYNRLINRRIIENTTTQNKEMTLN